VLPRQTGKWYKLPNGTGPLKKTRVRSKKKENGKNIFSNSGERHTSFGKHGTRVIVLPADTLFAILPNLENFFKNIPIQ
jgi:hypothetical protein